MFSDYVAHGFKLCPITPGLKGPTAKGWNTPERMVTHPLAAANLEAAGLCHAYSGTCAIDIDDMELAAVWLAARGVSLDELFAAPGAVQIKSPAGNHGKLLYRMLVPLPSKKIVEGKQNIIDFRCGTRDGLTVQDVLPPSPHPDKAGEVDGFYEWIGDWRNLPELPNELFALWQSLVTSEQVTSEVEPQQDRSALIAALKRRDPDMCRDDWIEVGQGIHHEFGGSAEGMRLWDAWSRQSKKYVGTDIEPCWRSFTAGGGITGNSIIQKIEASADEFPDEEQLAAINAAAPVPASAPIHLLTARELLQPHDSPPYLVRGLLEHNSEASLIGPSKSYKSLWAQQLGVCVSTGTPFFGRETEQGLVVYLAGEGFSGIRHRLQALRYGMDLDFRDAPFVVLPRPFALPTPEGVKLVRDYIAAAEAHFKQPLKLLIIDTYGRYAAGDENVAEDLYKFFRACSAARGNASLLVVHHTGHADATRGRGTSAWEQAVDTEFVASIKDDTDTRVFENTKQKDGEPCSQMYFKLARHKTDSTRVGDPVYSVVLEPAIMEAPSLKVGANEQIVLDVVNEMSGATQEAVTLAAIEKIPKSEGKDKRREYVRRALVGLISKHAIMLKGDNVFKAGDVGAEFADLIGEVQ
jgi:hypothetical protein